MILPQGAYVDIEADSEESTSRTYALDLKQKRIIGFIDGAEAMSQAIEKAFNTERFIHEIYSQNYGIEVINLIGKPFDFVTAVLQRRIEEALLADDRFLQMQDFNIEKIDSETLEISAKVITTQGTILVRKELNIL